MNTLKTEEKEIGRLLAQLANGDIHLLEAATKINECLARHTLAAQQIAAAEPNTYRDWPEDAAEENGKYQCRCSYCGLHFIGHKRRVVCHVCDIIMTIARKTAYASIATRVDSILEHWLDGHQARLRIDPGNQYIKCEIQDITELRAHLKKSLTA